MLQQMLSEESCWCEWLKIAACLQGWFCIISCSAPIIKAVNLISSTLHNSFPLSWGLAAQSSVLPQHVLGTSSSQGAACVRYHLNCPKCRALIWSTQTFHGALKRALPCIIWLHLLKLYRQKISAGASAELNDAIVTTD